MRSALFEQENIEREGGDGFILQSEKMLKVKLGPDVLSAKGAMVAYQGNVQFHHEGSGSMKKLLKKIVTNEDTPLMRCSGQGDVFFARNNENVFTILLEGDSISVEGRNLLAFESTVDWDIKRVKGAGALTAGLFNVQLTGHGQVALTCDGPPLVLDCSQQNTFVDMNAVVCWSASLNPQVVSSMNMRSMLRGGSGEAFQYAFSGPGFVVVQPSEGFTMGGQGTDSGSGGMLGGLLGD